MKRIDDIVRHPVFCQNLEANREAERDRRFCRHDMGHFLDVARIAMILNLEKQLELPQELIYGAALLHDIGKHQQYHCGIPHEQASAGIAPEILRACQFSEEEIEIIVSAILSHRDEAVKEQRNLNGILYCADKASRACFACDAEKECNWKGEKKNLQIKY